MSSGPGHPPAEQLRIPQTALAREITALARSLYPEYLFNHAVRTYLFGAAVGKSRGYHMDDEAFYIASVCHDFGLTESYRGPQPFEIQSADAAAKLLRERNVASSRVELIWDAIVLHCHGTIAVHKRPEVNMVSEGAGIDVAGPDADELPPQFLPSVVRAYPRLGFKVKFIQTCADVARLYPSATRRTFMQDIAERYVPDYRPAPNICDVIRDAPYAD